MEFTAKQIAEIIDGEIVGNPDVSISKVSKIEEGEGGSLTFLANPAYTKYIYTTKASIVITPSDFKTEENIESTIIRVERPDIAFAKLLDVYNNIKLNKTGVSEKASIAKTAKIGENVYIGDYVFIGDNVEIGNNSKIFPNVTICDNVIIGENTILFPNICIYSDNIIGKNCIIHAGTIIGSDGFRFNQQDNFSIKVPQIGNVIIQNDVEIGSNCSIDRATLGSTIIRNGAKIDNLVHIAHNVDIGENTLLAAHVCIAGSVKLGKNIMAGGQVGFSGHIIVADNVKIAAQSGIASSVKEDGALIMGSPAFDAKKYKRASIHFKNINELELRIRKLEQILKEK